MYVLNVRQLTDNIVTEVAALGPFWDKVQCVKKRSAEKSLVNYAGGHAISVSLWGD